MLFVDCFMCLVWHVADERLGTVVDGEYWDGVLKKLRAAKAQQRALEIFTVIARKHNLDTKSIRTKIDEDTKAALAPLSSSATADGKRSAADNTAPRTGPVSYTDDELYAIEADKPMEENEEEFNRDIPITQHPEPWHAKTKPKKPRFFNRVQAGYDWNRYNLVHFDEDNPPPKTVEGYKFNIFYAGTQRDICT